MARNQRTLVSFMLAGVCSAGWACARAPAHNSLDEARATALAVVSERRPLASRFTGETSRRVRPSSRESAGAHSTIGLEEAARIERLARGRTDVAAQSALAAAYLADDDVERAIRLLESCAARERGNAAVLNDLAAAYLLRSSVQRRADDLIRALTFAGRAIRLSSGLIEARFNRAQALDSLGLPAARDAWRDYASRDADSVWGRHARSRGDMSRQQRATQWDDIRQKLEAGSLAPAAVEARGQTQGIREYIEIDLLGRWGSLESTNAAGAQAALSSARVLAERLSVITGDRLPLESVQAVDRSTGSRRDTLARGHAAWSEGFALYDKDQREQSRPLLATAAAQLRAGGSPMWAWPELQGAVLDYHAARFDEALRRLGAVRVYADAGQFVSLGARARWVEAITLTQQGELDASLRKMQEAAATFEKLGEIENVVAIAGTTANSLRILGDAREAWTAVHQALTGLDAVRRPVRRYVLVHNAALLAFRMGFDEAAADLSRASVAQARSAQRPGPILEALTWTAAIDASLGDADQAWHGIREAERLLPEITDPVLRVPLAADIAFARSAALERSSPHEAATAAGMAVEVFSHRNPPMAFNVLPVKVRAERAAGRPELARRTLMSGIALFEERLRKLPIERFRISYFDNAWELYATAAQLELNADRQDAAFGYFERGRSRVLLENLTRSDAVVGLVAMQRAIPPGVTVVAYTSLHDELVTWVVSSRARALHRQPVPRASLEAEIESYAARVKTVDAQPAGTLERVLLEPWIRRITAGSTIAFVLDGALHRLAFAGLRVGDQYLVERHPISLIPSVSTYLALARSRPPAPPSAPRSALLVNAGEVNDPEHRLPNLPAVDLEIQEARRAYAAVSVIAGAAATPEKLTGLADSHDVVHFGGHAVANEEFPLRSSLVLPGGKRLTVEQLSRLAWRRVRLVVLAACSTARGPIWRGEGVLSLARPFLAAGVPTVAATLADVDDRVSGRLFAIFHREIGRGASPAQALRVAQMALLKTGAAGERAVAAWAPFVVIGVP
jgi:CHAT domain-containing protein/tetratricopeptide (TPR) repeat protein